MKFFKVVMVILYPILILNWMAPCNQCPSSLADLIPFSESSPSRFYDVVAVLMCVGTVIAAGKIFYKREDE